VALLEGGGGGICVVALACHANQPRRIFSSRNSNTTSALLDLSVSLVHDSFSSINLPDFSLAAAALPHERQGKAKDKAVGHHPSPRTRDVHLPRDPTLVMAKQKRQQLHPFSQDQVRYASRPASFSLSCIGIGFAEPPCRMAD